MCGPEDGSPSPAPDDDGDIDLLMNATCDELRRIAQALIHRERPDHTLQATALVNEAYLKLKGRNGFANLPREVFLQVAARAMRRILIDHARRHRTEKRGGKVRTVTLDSAILIRSDHLDLEALDEALHRLAELDPRQARVVELRFFGGLTMEEIAAVLGVSKRTVEGDWTFARAWLRRELGLAE